MACIHKERYLSILQTPWLQWLNDFIWIILFLLYLIKLFKDLEMNWYSLPKTSMWECTESRISYKKKKKKLGIWPKKSSTSKLPAWAASAFPTAVLTQQGKPASSQHSAVTPRQRRHLGNTSQVAQTREAPQLLCHAGVKRLEKRCLDVLFILL